MPLPDADLAAGITRAWARLTAAVDDRAAPLRTLVVAAADDDGVDARIMVLRAVDSVAARLTFFTDVRAAKVAAIVADPRVAVLGWDPGVQLQLRLRGVATVATAGAAIDAAWADVPTAARLAYRTTAAPGTVSATPEFTVTGDGRQHFARMTVDVDRLEWLDLAGPSHRRAACHRRDGEWQGSWRVP